MTFGNWMPLMRKLGCLDKLEQNKYWILCVHLKPLAVDDRTRFVLFRIFSFTDFYLRRSLKAFMDQQEEKINNFNKV